MIFTFTNKYLYMGSITLNNLQDATSVNTDYMYRDVHLDFQPEPIISNNNLYKEQTSIDIKVDLDSAAIKNSISNIFNTVPGEKILTPQFGLNLGRFLFEPITPATTLNIEQSIINGLSIWEPRVVLRQLNVIPNIESQEYHIRMIFIIPSLNNLTTPVEGLLSQPGFSLL